MGRHTFLNERLQSLPAENVAVLIKHLGIQTTEPQWLQLALAHRSILYAKETPNPGPDISSLLGMLQTLGSSLLNLALYDYAITKASFDTPMGAADLALRSTPLVLASLVNSLTLVDIAYWARSVPRSEQDGVAPVIALQILGSLYLSASYREFRNIVDPVISDIAQRLPADLSSFHYKRVLQECAQRMRKPPPRYDTLQETGPEHKKQFVIRVAVGNMSSEGEGPSKKEASQQAAAEWLRQHSPHTLAGQTHRVASTSSDKRSRYSIEDLPQSWLADSQPLRVALRIEPPKLPLLIEALTHRSVPGVRDYSMLAQLGSAVLEVAVTELIFNVLINNPALMIDGHQFAVSRTRLLEQPAVVRLAELLQLGRLLLMGKGQRTAGIVPSIFADVAQAVLATAYLVQAPATTIDSILPVDLRDHMFSVGFGSGLSDPKSRLQELFSTLALSVSYSSTHSGPAHNATFRAHCTISHIPSRTALSVGTGEGTSRKAAEAQLASQVLNTLTLISNFDAPDGTAMRTVLSQSPKLCKLFLSRELCSPPATRSNCALWWVRRLMGARALKARRLDLFSAWLSEIDSTLRDAPRTDDALFRMYFKEAREAATSELRLRFKVALAAVEKMIRGLDPLREKGDAQQDTGYGSLLVLSTIARLVAAPRRLARLRDELEDLNTLNTSARLPLIRIRGDISGIAIKQHDGAVLCLINRLTELLAGRVGSDTCFVFELHPRTRMMTLTINPLVSPAPPGESCHDDLLMDFLSEELSISEFKVDDISLSLRCGPFFDSMDNSRCARCVEMYRDSEYLYSEDAAAVAARLLHDLKNTIIGYNAELARDSLTPTEALAYKLRASKHRDAALLLIASLETLWGVLADPVGVELLPAQFIRSVVAEEYPTLPGGVRLLPPVSHTEEPFLTSPELLRSILHNLIKNACEAMPAGGDISVDCVRVDGVLILEVKDTGPGMSSEQIQKVLKGEAVASTRREGSGLGLLTVRAMVERLNGQIAGCSVSQSGMRWSIELNQLAVCPIASEA